MYAPRRGINYYSYKTLITAAKSCIELGKAGVRKSGQYWIDADGPTGPMPAELKMCEFAAGETYDWNDAAGHDPTQTVGTYNLIFIIITFIFLFFFLS